VGCPRDTVCECVSRVGGGRNSVGGCGDLLDCRTETGHLAVQVFEPGELVVDEWSEERVLAGLESHNPGVLRTNLSPEKEANLREAFGGA